MDEELVGGVGGLEGGQVIEGDIGGDDAVSPREGLLCGLMAEARVCTGDCTSGWSEEYDATGGGLTEPNAGSHGYVVGGRDVRGTAG